MTVSEVIAWYQQNEVRKLNAKAEIERVRVRSLFADINGDRDVADCRPADLLAFLNAQKDAESFWTLRRFNATINRPFNFAASVGLISKNPFRGLKIPEGKCGRDWTDAEFRAILRNSKPHFRQLVVFCRFGGARPGEGRTLEWPEVRDDLQACIQEKHKTSWTSKDPRRIYWNNVLTRLLIFMRRNQRHPSNVFVNHFGRPWTLDALVKHMDKVRKRAKLPDDVRLHCGRHTFSTSALMNGVDIYTLAQLLGHKSVKTTERYLHLLNKRRHLNDAMQKAIGGNKGGSRAG